MNAPEKPAAGSLRQTPLCAIHRESGAKMVSFCGWEMPVAYSGLIKEHMAVRQAAGLFDVSHMGEVEVEGPGSFAFLQRVTSNDLAKIVDGQAQYSALPMPSGCPVDDVVILRRGAERFLIIVNGANIDKDQKWLHSQGPEGCTVTDRSEEYAVLALQGPLAQDILQGLTPTDLDQIGFYRFAEAEVGGQPAVVSRTGYTGEDGFELLVSPERAEAVWRGVMEAGRPAGLVPVGLGARDTLRLEARMCLYGQDVDETTTLVEAGLGWIVSLAESKGEFVGRDVLEEQKSNGTPRRLVGFEMVGRGIARHGYPVHIGGQPVGAVTSGTYAPFLRKNLGLCYVPTSFSTVGTTLQVEIRDHKVGARVVPTPFYKRPAKVPA